MREDPPESPPADVPSAAAAPSLLDQDFFALDNTAPPAVPQSTFDPFSAPAPATAPASNATANQFLGSFSSPQQNQAGFDPFMNQNAVNASAPNMANPMLPPQYASQPHASQSQQHFMGSLQQRTSQPVSHPPHMTLNGSPAAGTFSTGVQPRAPVAAAAAAGPTSTRPKDAWGDGSKLFDLSDLKSNGGPAAAVTTSQLSGNSFSGLDALAGMAQQPPPSMNAMRGPPHPMGMQYPRQNMNMGMQQQQQQHFQQQPMGMGMAPGMYRGGMQQQQGMSQQHPGGRNMMNQGNMGMPPPPQQQQQQQFMMNQGKPF